MIHTNLRHTLPAFLAIVILAALGSMTSCTKTVKQTDILVQDSIRHYYPLVQGTDLVLVWKVANVGSAPLVITDIQPSCGCLVEDADQERVVAPGKEVRLKFTFRSEKNSGYVRHTVRIFGNMAPQGMTCLTFDLNVVPPGIGSSDYEELHKDRYQYNKLTSDGSTLNDEQSKRDYWVDTRDYPKGYNNDYWRLKDVK